MVAPIGPMPGTWASRRLSALCRCQAISRASTAFNCRSRRAYSRPCRANNSRARAGSVSSAASRASSAAILSGPLAATTPNSAAWPRIALPSWVRLRTRRSRMVTSISAACWSTVLTGTKRMVGRLIASHRASASAASFLLRLT